MTTFKDLGLAGTILRAVETEGYSTPTPIQAQAIPPLLAGRDLLGIAQTGTGKTAAFALPILHRLGADRRPPQSRRARVLVLAPTRELAAQIAESFRTYGRNSQMQVAVIFGGVSYGPQVKALNRGLDVLVATPGRLLDHLEQGTLRLDGT
ncbi:MAG: DEAD/DEAH box helicase, partial [Beijerinckiaceae bacterium]